MKQFKTLLLTLGALLLCSNAMADDEIYLYYLVDGEIEFDNSSSYGYVGCQFYSDVTSTWVSIDDYTMTYGTVEISGTTYNCYYVAIPTTSEVQYAQIHYNGTGNWDTQIAVDFPDQTQTESYVTDGTTLATLADWATTATTETVTFYSVNYSDEITTMYINVYFVDYSESDDGVWGSNQYSWNTETMTAVSDMTVSVDCETYTVAWSHDIPVYTSGDINTVIILTASDGTNTYQSENIYIPAGEYTEVYYLYDSNDLYHVSEANECTNTAIEAVEAEVAEGPLPVYSISGAYITTVTGLDDAALKALPKGLYIVGGQRYLAK